MRGFFGMILAVAVICGVSGLTLSYLKEMTAPLIEVQVLTNVKGPAIHNVYPAAANSPIEERRAFVVDGRSVMVFPYMRDGGLVGVALESGAKGYGGDISVMVGFNIADDTLLGIGITQSKETPGIGTKAAEPPFAGQFAGKRIQGVELTSRGGEINAISGATISSVGAVAAVQAAARDFLALKTQIQQTWQ